MNMGRRLPLLAGLLISVTTYGARPAAKPKPPIQTAEERQAQAILKTLNLHDRVAQLVLASCYSTDPNRNSKDLQKYRHLVADVHVGGLTCVNPVEYGLAQSAEPHALAVFLNQM